MISIALACYLFGLIFGPYRLLLGLPDIHFDTRNGPFFGFIFVTIGYVIAIENIDVSLKNSTLLACFGLALQLVEGYIISIYSLGTFSHHNYLFGTLLYGVGVFFIAKNLNGIYVIKKLSILGPLSLGMYCIHVAVLKFIGIFFNKNDIGELFLLSISVVTISLVGILILKRIPILKNTVY